MQDESNQMAEKDDNPYRMYQWDMPTETFKKELAEKNNLIAHLQRRVTALEAFLPDGLEIDDDGTVSVKTNLAPGTDQTTKEKGRES